MVLGSISLLFHHFGLKFDDVTVALSLIVLSSNFLAMYIYLDTTKFSHQILSRLNGIFMVRQIGQFLLSGGGGVWLLHPSASSLCLILGTRWQLQSEIFFHGQMPQGCAYSQQFGSPHSLEKLKNLLGCGILFLGHWRVTKLFSSYAQK